MRATVPDQTTLAVLVADELPGPLDDASRLVADAGHRVVARATTLTELQAGLETPELGAAVVALHDDREHALMLVEAVALADRCPLVLLLERDDPLLVAAALDRGADAYADRGTLGALESALALARRRYAEVRRLTRQLRELEQGAGRHAVVERAKGVVMERHGIDEHAAYEMLRRQARSARTPVVQVAQSVLDARALF